MAWHKETLIARQEVREELKKLGLYPHRRPSASAESPNATMVVTDGQGKNLEAITARVLASCEQLKHVSMKLYYLAVFLLENGLRIGEALSVQSIDITSTALVHVKGLKRSSNRICHAGLSREYLLKCKASKVSPWAEFDYWFVRRQFMKVGLFYITTGAKNAKVTHIFRHLAVSSAQSVAHDLETSKQFIGHKSSKNTERYESFK